MSEIRVDSITDEVGTSSPDFPNGILKSSFPSDSVLQVVNSSTSTIVAINNDTYTSTTLSGTITPNFTSSKVLVIVAQFAQTGGDDDGKNYYAQTKLSRDGSKIADIGQPSYGYFHRADFGNTAGANFRQQSFFIGTQYLDSPSTTSAVTYTTEGHTRSDGASTLTYQRNGAISYITLMEIAG